MPTFNSNGRPRDNQRQRLYDAQNTASAVVTGNFQVQSIPNADLQAWVDKALDRRAVRSRWPGRHITVTLKRGGSAYGYHYEQRISLPAFARNEWTVLHEIAHCLTPRGHASHGPEYAGVLLHLVGAVLGADARTALRDAYKANRVLYTLQGIPQASATVLPSRAERAAAERAQERRPLDASRAHEAAGLLRRSIAAGQHGAPGTRTRDAALLTARTLERIAAGK